VADEAHARRLAAAWPLTASLLAGAFWPGPLTLVVERASHIPAAIAGGSSSVAVRVPSHPVARALLSRLGAPVAAPSANRYQGLSPTTAAHVVKELGDRVDLVLDGGGCDGGIESTVVDARLDPPVVLRPGAVSLEALAAIAAGIVSVHDDPSSDQGRASPGMDARHYAPRAPLTLAPTRAAAIALAKSIATTQGTRVGLVLHEPAMPDAAQPADAAASSERRALEGEAHVVLRVLPRDAIAYARALYGTLHDLDDEPVGAIVVQDVPADASWWAVADRLARGSKRLA
ncbi:MAG TPA: L-threonylcarbamoyladenylate synthase, partial [Polyangiaceae bacterium]|nr:L-threonylcarbamoyladenylate synthase [Polyangiaceae bacterium]